MRASDDSRGNRYRLGVLLRALRWRADSSFALLLVVLVAAVAAAAGPIYLEAAGVSALRAALLSQPVWQTGLTISSPSSTPVGIGAFDAALSAVPREAGAPLFDDPIVTQQHVVGLPENYQANVVSRTGICLNLVFVAGHCPTNGGTVALSQRSAAALHATVGVGLAVGHATAVVGGIYRLPDANAPFWWGDNYFPFGSGPQFNPFVDDVFTAPASFGPGRAFPSATITLQLPLDLTTAQAVGPAGVVSAVNAYAALLKTPAYGLGSITDLVGDLTSVASEQNLMTTVVTVVDVELVLLALCVLYSTVARTAEERRAETRLARLRGFPLSSVLSVAVSEPVALVLVSFPVGVLLAWSAVAGVGAALFTGGTPVKLPLLSIGTAAAACLGAALAIGLSGWQLARSNPLGERGPRGPRSRLSRDSLDLAAVVLALAALGELATTGVVAGGRTDPVAALAPALVALGLAVVGMRVVPLAAAGVVRMARRRGRLGGFLAARRITRRPPLVRQMVLVSVAFALLVFAAAGWVVASRNRAVYGDFTIGAPQVVSVTIPTGADFVGDVRRADPSGRQAMAVEYSTVGGTLLAVDSTRLAAVATWPAGLSPQPAAEVAGLLDPPTPPAVTLSGSALRATITYAPTTPTPGDPARRLPVMSLVATVFDETYQSTGTVTLGPLLPGAHAYVTSIAGACGGGGGCRIVSLSPAWNPNLNPAVTERLEIEIAGFEQQLGTRWAPVDAFLGTSTYWLPVALVPGVSTGPDVTTDGGALVLTVTPADYAIVASENTFSGAVVDEPTVAAADVPSPIPVVMTSDVASADQGPVDAPEPLDGFDENSLSVSDKLSPPLLPDIGSTGTLIDLTFALDSMSAQAEDVQYQVWLTGDASPAIMARLRADGFRVTGTQSGAQIAAKLGRGGLALAYDFFVFAALVAVLLASGSALFAIRVAARRTAADLAALVAVGVTRRTLRRSVVAEHATVLLAGVLLGVIGGGVGVAIALQSLPEFASSAVVPPLSYSLPVAPLGIVVACAVAVVALAVTVATVLTMAGARPELLREEVA